MEAKTVAKVVIDEFICWFGTLHTDQGRHVESALFKELCSILYMHNQIGWSSGAIGYLNIPSINASQNTKIWDELLPKPMCAYKTIVFMSPLNTHLFH